jgi:hypothetical protein
MKRIAHVALGCTLASLLGVAFSSRTFSEQNNAAQAPRQTNVNGVESIAGQPFSADLEIEHNQTLLDGSHIHTVQHEKFYRDGEGRIRYETYNRPNLDQQAPEELTSVTITDAPANARYTLQPRTHIAQRSAIFAPPVQAQVAPRPIPAPVQEQETQPQRKITNEDLGTQTIDAISAEGRRYTVTLAANTQGNDAPLTYSGETWYSTEMGLQIVQKLNDPRSGETVRRFTNIARGEPDPSLFQVPADYTIRNPQ